jgi:hypothetical protein
MFANRLAGFGGNFFKPDGTPEIESEPAFQTVTISLSPLAIDRTTTFS